MNIYIEYDLISFYFWMNDSWLCLVYVLNRKKMKLKHNSTKAQKCPYESTFKFTESTFYWDLDQLSNS